MRKSDGVVANAQQSLNEAVVNLRETVGEEALSFREAQKLSLLSLPQWQAPADRVARLRDAEEPPQNTVWNRSSLVL